MPLQFTINKIKTRNKISEKSLNNQQQNQLSYPQNNVNNNIDIVQKNTNPILFF